MSPPSGRCCLNFVETRGIIGHANGIYAIEMVGTTQKIDLADAFAQVTRQGVDVIASLSDAVYRGDDPETSIGAHFRHNLEFAEELLRGSESGVIDYAARRRDLGVATDRSAATERMETMINRLDSIAAGPVTVVSELDRSTRLSSSVERELEFILSHTIHHYALIAFKLRLLGIEVPVGFGVAPSTIEYRKSRS